LTVEVTLQPIRRFGFDAAILFSDILVVSEAMGQPYRFRDGGGIEMEFAIETESDVDRLEVEPILERLDYVSRAIPLIRRELNDRTALIGFAGSPWTLANFMIEGGSSRDFIGARRLFHLNPPLFSRLMEKLTDAVARYLNMQIAAGVDAVQIFDTLGGLLPPSSFQAASARWMQAVVERLERRVPVIVFSKGVHGHWPALAATGAQVLGVDWTVRLEDVRKRLPAGIGLQGNLDPFFLNTTPEVVAAETRAILSPMRGSPGYIFNLGHGVPPTARLENIEALVETVRSFS
jgi:uroporphyrinogen decarboxylase